MDWYKTSTIKTSVQILTANLLQFVQFAPSPTHSLKLCSIGLQAWPNHHSFSGCKELKTSLNYPYNFFLSEQWPFLPGTCWDLPGWDSDQRILTAQLVVCSYVQVLWIDRIQWISYLYSMYQKTRLDLLLLSPPFNHPSFPHLLNHTLNEGFYFGFAVSPIG